MADHNHSTRGIRPSGQCQACDEYSQTKVWQPVSVPDYCYTRHEPAPGVHQDIPHLNTQCMAEYIICAKQIEHHHHLDLDPHKGWHCTTCGEWLPLDYRGEPA